MANFTIAGRLKNMPDIQRSYMWELFIPSIEELDQDDMVLRIRNAVIPGRTIQPIESFFLGSKQFHPGKTEYTGTFTTNIEEFEDGKAHASLHSWMQAIYDANPNSSTAGQSKLAGKNEYTRDIVLRMYKNDGTKMDKDIVFYNSFPSGISDATLDYTASDAVRLDVTWQYDFWLPR